VNASRQAKNRREILQSSESIPPLPDSVVRLLRALNAPETEPEDLEGLLQSDPVLVGKMLAMVNSPFFGLNRSVTTVREAVMVLGFRGIRTLALASSTCKFLSQDFSCYGYGQRGLWQHSMAVATMCRHLARACGMGANRAEELFVAGLLHDMGKMLLARYIENANLEVGVDGSATDVERRAAGVTHDEAGALVAAKWNLSPELQDLIANHHDEDAPASEGLAVLRVADALAHQHGAGLRLEARRTAGPSSADIDRLTLAADGWQSLADEALALAEEALRSFGSEPATSEQPRS